MMISPIVKSLLVLCSLSTLVAFSCATNLWGFVRVFLAMSIGQIIAYNIYKQILELIAAKLANERISEYSKQGKDVICPCSKAVKNFIPIQLDADNSYKCLECNKNVSVNVEVKTFLETQPLDLEKSNAALNAVASYAERTTIDRA